MFQGCSYGILDLKLDEVQGGGLCVLRLENNKIHIVILNRL